MPDLGGLGRLLVLIGGVIVGVGVLLAVVSKLPGVGDGLGWLGKLPGDIYIKRDNFTFYFPLATSALISVVLSLVFYLLSRR